MKKGVITHKPLNDFMITYQTLLSQSQSTQLVITEYQKKNKGFIFDLFYF